MALQPVQYLQEYVPALLENQYLEALFDLEVLLGYKKPSHPVVGIIQFALIPIWLFFGSFMLLGLTFSGYVGFAFSGYMLFAALAQWDIVENNLYDEVFAWLFVNIDSNFIVGFMVYPTKELMSTFLELEDEKKFTPMNEWQAYFFTLLMYPYIYFIALAVSFAQLVTIPIMLFWYFIDPEILVSGQRADGTAIPKDNYALIFAEADAIQALLFLDLRYLYQGKQSFTISVTNFCVHWVTSLTLIVTSPLLVFPMAAWLGIAFFQVTVIYLYSIVILNNRSEEMEQQYDAIDVYY